MADQTDMHCNQMADRTDMPEQLLMVNVDMLCNQMADKTDMHCNQMADKTDMPEQLLIVNVDMPCNQMADKADMHCNQMAYKTDMLSNQMDDKTDMHCNQIADKTDMPEQLLMVNVDILCNQIADKIDMHCNQMADKTDMLCNQMADKTDMHCNQMADKTDMLCNQIADKTDMSEQLMMANVDMLCNQMADKTDMHCHQMADKTDMLYNQMADKTDMFCNQMADKTDMTEQLLMANVDYSDCGISIPSIWTNVPLHSTHMKHESEDTEKDESENITDCVDDEDGLLSDWVDLCVVADGKTLLLTISLAVVHLVDGDWNIEVGRGDFSIDRHVIQGSTELAIVAKVGENLRWPLSRDVRAFKVDKFRYLFLIPTPEIATHEQLEDIAIHVTSAEELNYVVSFQEISESSLLDLLDNLLEQHTQFNNSSLVEKGYSLPEAKGKYYNSRFAKAVASGTRKLVRGLGFVSGAYSSQVQKGGKFLIDHMEANVRKSSEIDPRFMKSIQRVKKLSKATENISENALKRIHNLTTCIMKKSAKQSKAGKKFFNSLPGEMLLVSWESFNKITEAMEEAGKNALKSTSSVATDIVKHRYGEEVGMVAKDTLAVAGHTVSAAMNIARIRNVIVPASVGMTNLGKAVKKSL